MIASTRVIRSQRRDSYYMLDVDPSIGDVIKSCSEEARKWWLLRQKQKDEKRFVAILDKMPRNPQYKFRETELMANEIGDVTAK